jgi:hypothetical protein
MIVLQLFFQIFQINILNLNCPSHPFNFRSYPNTFHRHIFQNIHLFLKTTYDLLYMHILNITLQLHLSNLKLLIELILNNYKFNYPTLQNYL